MAFPSLLLKLHAWERGLRAVCCEGGVANGKSGTEEVGSARQVQARAEGPKREASRRGVL